MNIIGLKKINSVNLLKISDTGELTALVNNNTINIQTGGAPNVYPTVNVPIPFDADDDTLTLIVDISLTESGFDILDDLSNSNLSSFTQTIYNNGEVVSSVARINMYDYVGQVGEEKNNIGKMKIIYNGQLIDLPENGIGTAYYGSTVCFKIDEDMFRMPTDNANAKNFQLGKTYYCRYTWMDFNGNTDEWKGFAFTYDAVINKPIVTNNIENYLPVVQHNNVTGDITLDYLDGQIHHINASNNVNISNVLNIPYGKAMFIYVTTNNNTITLNNSKTLNSNITSHLITAYNHIGICYSINQAYITPTNN